MYVEHTVIRLGDRCQRSHCQLWKREGLRTMEAIGIYLIPLRPPAIYLFFGHLALLLQKIDVWSFVILLDKVQCFQVNYLSHLEKKMLFFPYAHLDQNLSLNI